MVEVNVVQKDSSAERKKEEKETRQFGSSFSTKLRDGKDEYDSLLSQNLQRQQLSHPSVPFPRRSCAYTRLTSQQRDPRIDRRLDSLELLDGFRIR